MITINTRQGLRSPTATAGVAGEMVDDMLRAGKQATAAWAKEFSGRVTTR